MRAKTLKDDSIQLIEITGHAPIPGYNVERHNHSYYQICYVIEGKGTVSISNKNFKMSKGDIFIFNPFEYHSLKSDEKHPSETIVIGIGLKNNIWSLYIPKEYNIISKTKDTKTKNVKDILKHVIKEHSKKELGYKEIEISLLNQLLVTIQRIIKKNLDKRTIFSHKYVKKTDRMEEIKNYIYRNYRNKLSLDNIAQAVFLSKYHLLHEFKKALGITPYEYIQQLRIDDAKRLLNITNKTVSEIAFEVGFESISQFNRTFKKISKTSPSQYKNRTTT